MLDEAGRVLDGWFLTLPHTTITDVTALALGSSRKQGDWLLLISLRGDDYIAGVDTDDLDLWRRLVAEGEARGTPVRDWIVVGGERLRSHAFATDPDRAWT